jgi:serine/threonine protein kinase
MDFFRMWMCLPHHHMMFPLANTIKSILENNDVEKIHQSKIQLIKKLGDGAQGEVYKSIYCGEPYAAKIIPIERKTLARATKLARHEFDIVTRLNHPGIIKYHHLFLLTNDQEECVSICILMDLIDGKDLFSHSAENGFGPEQLSVLFEQLLDILLYLEKRKVRHRDIKPENILITTTGQPIVIDFGFADDLSQEKLWSICGTGFYVHPYIIEGKCDQTNGDLWALGITMAALCGCSVFPQEILDSDKSDQEILRHLLDKKKLLLEELEGCWFAKYVRMCLYPGPSFPVRYVVAELNEYKAKLLSSLATPDCSECSEEKDEGEIEQGEVSTGAVLVEC